MENLGPHMMRFGVRQQRTGLARDGIGFNAIGEGEHVGRIEDVEEFLGVARGLAEAVD